MENSSAQVTLIYVKVTINTTQYIVQRTQPLRPLVPCLGNASFPTLCLLRWLCLQLKTSPRVCASTVASGLTVGAAPGKGLLILFNINNGSMGRGSSH